MLDLKPLSIEWLKKSGIIKHHINSFNSFIRRKLPQIIKEHDNIQTGTGYTIKFGEIKEPVFKEDYVDFGALKVYKPLVIEADGSKRRLYPLEARIRNLNYFGPITLEIGVYKDDEEIDYGEVTIGMMPVMVKSELCNLHGLSYEELVKLKEDPFDPGGYFIVNGSERVLIIIEDLTQNRIMLEREEKGMKTVEIAKIFSKRGGFRAQIKVIRDKDGILYCAFPSIPGGVPLVILMKALGLEKDKDIYDAIILKEDPEIANEILVNLETFADIKTKEEAMDYISRKIAPGQIKEFRLKRTEHAIDKYLLPHLGVNPEDRIKKAKFLGRMALKVIEFGLGRRLEDDKDHYLNKRLRLAEDLLEDVFRVAFYKFVQDMKYQLDRLVHRGKRISVKVIARSDILTERIRHALATGTWVGGRTGVSQLLDRTCFMSTMSHLRRVVSPLSRSQPNFEARDLHGTHWGRICTTETPEGPNCGLVKNLALGCEITTEVPEDKIEELLYKELGVMPIRK